MENKEDGWYVGTDSSRLVSELTVRNINLTPSLIWTTWFALETYHDMESYAAYSGLTAQLPRQDSSTRRQLRLRNCRREALSNHSRGYAAVRNSQLCHQMDSGPHHGSGFEAVLH